MALYFLKGMRKQGENNKIYIYTKEFFFKHELRPGSCSVHCSYWLEYLLGMKPFVQFVWVSLVKQKSQKKSRFHEKCGCIKHTYKLVSVW